MAVTPSYINSDEFIQQKLTEAGYESKPTDPAELETYNDLVKKFRNEYYKKGYSSPQSEYQIKNAEPTPQQTAQDITAEQQNLVSQGTQVTTPFSGTTYRAPNRVVSANANNLQKAQIDLITNPTRGKTLSVYRTAKGAVQVYSGDQLVDEFGNIARSGYAADGSDIKAEYFGADASEKAAMIGLAQRLGYYQGNKPSVAAINGTGFDGTDRAAFQSLLDFSTSQGYTWRAIVSMVNGGSLMVGNYASAGGGGQGPGYTFEDAAAQFKQSALRELGRVPTKAEIDAAVSAIRSSKTNPAITGQAQAIQASPGEATAYKVGNAISRMFALMGGR
jgi:hypothetical protein